MTAAKLSRIRINARLPADVARKAAYIERRTGKSTTEVVVESIERYYAAITTNDGAEPDPLADFIGCGDGPVDLSSSYKNQLARSLEKKGK